MKKFKLLPLLLIIVLALSAFPSSALALTPPDIAAQAAVLMNANTGEIYYEKDADSVTQPSAIAKMVNAMLVVEAIEEGNISLSDSVTAYDDCRYNLDDSSADSAPSITPGEVMTVEDLLYCSMLLSANEASNILAEYVSGSISNFVDAMNNRASELGCTNTHFSNANGLPADDSRTTARDLAILTREAMSHSMLREICSSRQHTVPETNVNGARELTNTNSLLHSDGEFYFESAYGVKTGYYESGGYSLAAAAKRGERDVVAVILGETESGRQFTDAATLFNWFFNNYEEKQILDTLTTLMTLKVNTGNDDTVDVRAEEPITVVLPVDYDISQIKLQPVLNQDEDTPLEPPVVSGTILGEVTAVEVDGNGNVVRTFGTTRLLAANGAEISPIHYMKGELRSLFEEPLVHRVLMILVILLILYVLLVIFYRIQRIRHVRSVRRAKRERALRQTREDAAWLSIPDEEEEDPQIDYFNDEEEDEHPALRGRRGDR